MLNDELAIKKEQKYKKQTKYVLGNPEDWRKINLNK